MRGVRPNWGASSIQRTHKKRTQGDNGPGLCRDVITDLEVPRPLGPFAGIRLDPRRRLWRTSAGRWAAWRGVRREPSPPCVATRTTPSRWPWPRRRRAGGTAPGLAAVPFGEPCWPLRSLGGCYGKDSPAAGLTCSRTHQHHLQEDSPASPAGGRVLYSIRGAVISKQTSACMEMSPRPSTKPGPEEQNPLGPISMHWARNKLSVTRWSWNHFWEVL